MRKMTGLLGLLLSLQLQATAQNEGSLVPFVLPAHQGTVQVTMPGEPVPTRPYVKVFANVFTYGEQDLGRVVSELKVLGQQRGFDGVIVTQTETRSEEYNPYAFTDLLVATANLTSRDPKRRADPYPRQYTSFRTVMYVTVVGYRFADNFGFVRSMPQSDTLYQYTASGERIVAGVLPYDLKGVPGKFVAQSPEGRGFFEDEVKWYNLDWLLRSEGGAWKTREDNFGRVGKRIFKPGEEVLMRAELLYGIVPKQGKYEIGSIELRRRYPLDGIEREGMALAYDDAGRLTEQRIQTKDGRLIIRHVYAADGQLLRQEAYRQTAQGEQPVYVLSRSHQTPELVLAALGS